MRSRVLTRLASVFAWASAGAGCFASNDGSNHTGQSSGAASSAGAAGSGSSASSTGAAAASSSVSHPTADAGASASSASQGGASTKAGLVGPYTTSGNKILDKNGSDHLLRGLDRPSLEWSCSGDIQEVNYEDMAAWGANVVRMPLNQDCWLQDASNPSKDANYAALVDTQVTWAKNNHMDIILDLHWSDKGDYSVGHTCLTSGTNCQQDMADAHSVTFWQQVATKYANVPNVIFELYNEPHVGSYHPGAGDWTTWLNGGTSSGFAVAGMQQLYDTIRQTGANNLVVVGGLNWAADLTQVTSHLVHGSGGAAATNVVYNVHQYKQNLGGSSQSWPSTFMTNFGSLAATYPVIATEFGDGSQGQKTDPNNPSGDCDPTFDSSFIAFANAAASGANPAHKISWTAWAFYAPSNECTFPALLTDSNTDAPNAVGAVVKAALQAGP